MARNVKGALLQATWTGDKKSMIDKHVEYAHKAADQGAQVMCFQELFYGPYFCQVQDPEWYDITEPIPDGPTTKLMQDVAKETGMVLIVPMYEEDGPGIYYNTAAVIDADGTYLGKYRKTHIPHLPGFWEKYYFRPGNLGYPVFDTAVGKVGVYICYDRHFPEGARMLGLHGAELVFIPSARRCLAVDDAKRLLDLSAAGMQSERRPRMPRFRLAYRADEPRHRQRLFRRYDQPRRHRAAGRE